MCPSLIQIGSKTAEKNSAQTNKQTNKQTDTTKIMVTWPWTKNIKDQLYTTHTYFRAAYGCKPHVLNLWLCLPLNYTLNVCNDDDNNNNNNNSKVYDNSIIVNVTWPDRQKYISECSSLLSENCHRLVIHFQCIILFSVPDRIPKRDSPTFYLPCTLSLISILATCPHG